MRSLLYGGNIDRAAKARARVGLAILAFAVVYAIIAARLVMFALVSDSRIAHHGVAGDAIATARPDILDRNGEILATDVRVPSLYGEPRRIIDVDEAVELLDRRPARSRRRRIARTALLASAASSGSSATSRPSSSAKSIARACPASASSTRTSAPIRTAPRSRTSSATSTSTIRASPAWRSGSTGTGSPRCTWRGSPPTGCRTRSSSPSICACSTRCATSSSPRAPSSRRLPPPASSSMCAPARSSPWCRSRTTTRTIRARRSIRRASTG